MSAILAAFLLLFLPTASAIVMTCEANITRRSRHQRKAQPRSSTAVEASTPRTGTDRGGSNKTGDRRRTKRSVALPQPARNRNATTAPTEPEDTSKNTNKDQTTDRAPREEARDGDKKGGDKKKSTGSSSELEEKTCEEMAIDAEEAETQSMKDTDKEKKEPDTGPNVDTGTSAPRTGPWPIDKSKSVHGKSVFDPIEKKDELTSEFELDSVKRLHKMSKETCNASAHTAYGSKEVVVEISKALPPPVEKSHAPTPKKKTKKDKKKEDEVRRWNEAIARGNVFRPRKDDETVDEVEGDWGKPM